MWAPSSLTTATMRGDAAFYMTKAVCPHCMLHAWASRMSVVGGKCLLHPREALLPLSTARQHAAVAHMPGSLVWSLWCRQGSLTISVRIAGDKGKGGVKDLKQLSGGYSTPVSDPRMVPPDYIKMQ